MLCCRNKQMSLKHLWGKWSPVGDSHQRQCHLPCWGKTKIRLLIASVYLKIFPPSSNVNERIWWDPEIFVKNLVTDAWSWQLFPDFFKIRMLGWTILHLWRLKPQRNINCSIQVKLNRQNHKNEYSCKLQLRGWTQKKAWWIMQEASDQLKQWVKRTRNHKYNH